MSSRLMQNTTRGRLRQYPRGVLQHHGAASSRRQFSIGAAFAAASASTAESITFIHHCGLPWYVTIPLVAAGINFTCRLPVYWYVRTVQNRRSKIMPLYQAWATTHAHERGTMPASWDRKKREAEVFKRIRKSRQHLYREFNCQTWKSFTAAFSMTPFIVVTDALRRLVGHPSISQSGTSTELIDPSIVEGGLAWFTDLTAQDPYLILPAACTAVMASYAWRGMTAKTLMERLTHSRSGPTSLSYLSDIFGRVAIIIPFIPLVLYTQPAAIFLYWITTFGLNHLNNAIYDRFLPVPKPDLKPPPESPKDVPKPWIHSGNEGKIAEAEPKNNNNTTTLKL